MTIFSLYIFDKHCECVYFQDWNKARKGLQPGPSTLPGVSAAFDQARSNPNRSSNSNPSQMFSSQSGIVVAEAAADRSSIATSTNMPNDLVESRLAFDENAKLIYGVVFSIRNMIRKLSVPERNSDDSFFTYNTSSYKLHYFATLTGFQFILFTDLNVEPMHSHLKHLYSTCFIEHVVRNPLIGLDSAKSRQGIDNEAFRKSVDTFMRNLNAFD